VNDAADSLVITQQIVDHFHRVPAVDGWDHARHRPVSRRDRWYSALLNRSLVPISND